MKISKQTNFVGSTPMGTELSILNYEIDSEKAGKHIYIQSGIHGGEITQWILHELFSFLKANLQQGKVTLVPCANPVSWTQRVYYSTNGKFDFYMGKDWNRNFPGNADGSMGERIAGILFGNAKKADFALDLHTSRESIPFGIYSRPEYEDILKRLFPWADVEIDEEFYDEYDRQTFSENFGIYDKEDDIYHYDDEDYLEWKNRLPKIRPYENIAGEVDYYRVKLNINEIGTIFLKLDEYLENTSSYILNKDDIIE